MIKLLVLPKLTNSPSNPRKVLSSFRTDIKYSNIFFSSKRENYKFSLTRDKTVKDFVFHSGHSADNGNYDICIITVTADLSLKLNSVPCLATPSIDLNSNHGAQCWIAGWGLTSWNGSLPSKLQSAGVNLMSRPYCLQHRKPSSFLNLRSNWASGRYSI